MSLSQRAIKIAAYRRRRDRYKSMAVIKETESGPNLDDVVISPVISEDECRESTPEKRESSEDRIGNFGHSLADDLSSTGSLRNTDSIETVESLYLVGSLSIEQSVSIMPSISETPESSNFETIITVNQEDAKPESSSNDNEEISTKALDHSTTTALIESENSSTLHSTTQVHPEKTTQQDSTTDPKNIVLDSIVNDSKAAASPMIKESLITPKQSSPEEDDSDDKSITIGLDEIVTLPDDPTPRDQHLDDLSITFDLNDVMSNSTLIDVDESSLVINIDESNLDDFSTTVEVIPKLIEKTSSQKRKESYFAPRMNSLVRRINLVAEQWRRRKASF